MNKNLWNLYKQSEQGKKMIALFNPDETPTYDTVEQILVISNQDVTNIGNTKTQLYLLEDLFFNLNEQQFNFYDDDPKEEYQRFIDTFNFHEVYIQQEDGSCHLGKIIINKDQFRQRVAITHLTSLALYYRHSHFKPLLRPHNFTAIQSACDKLEINIPPIQRTTQWKEYLSYYYELCTALNFFQETNELTDAELCACIYDFAPNFLNQNDTITTDLPDPTNIWIVGADKNDVKMIEQEGIYNGVWQCNERTRRGDIIVMYARTPYSCIHSIWRANSSGIFNPFDYYHTRTTVQNGIIIPPITFAELKSHPYFSQLPIVRKNLQGVNGIELTAQDYTVLLKCIAQKGGNIDQLPKLLDTTVFHMPDIQIEKDVEEKLLIPLLTRLDYADTDYTRQLVHKFGRNNKAIPDFVFFPKIDTKDIYTAPFLIEAKLDLRSSYQQEKDFRQAYSYAKAIGAHIFALCDKERLIIYTCKNGYADKQNPVFENHWAVINTDPATFLQLKKLIGKETIEQTKKYTK